LTFKGKDLTFETEDLTFKGKDLTFKGKAKHWVDFMAIVVGLALQN